ncbi:MAG: recombinase family protein [Myxococcota bacterium]
MTQASQSHAQKIGYARVSREDQDLQMQVDALNKAGCTRIFKEKRSGAKKERPQFVSALETLGPGDTFVVWKLDRIGRSLKQMLALVELFEQKGIQLQSLTDGIHTQTAAGRFFFHIMAALAEMERDLIRERTQAGLAAARARGKKGGRRPKDPNDPKVRRAQKMHKDHTLSIDDICQSLSISRSTLYRYLKLNQ